MGQKLNHLFCYRLEEAERIRQMYNSWIGKEAHVGKGHKAVLLSITIKQKRQSPPAKSSEKIYRVEFEFEAKKRFSAWEFLFHNSLQTTFHHPYITPKKKDEAA